MDEQEHFRDCYARLREGQEKHVEMMRAAIQGEPHSTDEFVEVSRLHDEFMAAGAPFMRQGPRVTR